MSLELAAITGSERRMAIWRTTGAARRDCCEMMLAVLEIPPLVLCVVVHSQKERPYESASP